MTLLLELFRQYDHYIFALAFSLARIHAFISASQLLSNSIVPTMARNAVIMTLMLFVAPVNFDFASGFDVSLFSFAAIFVKEYAIGFLLGNLVGWVFWAVAGAGSLIDNQRGTAIAASIDPMQGEESPTLSNLFSLMFITYAFVTGAVLPLLAVVYQSFVLWPVDRMAPLLSEALPKHVLAVFDYAMQVMFDLGAPIVAVMFLAEFALAIVSRFAPQVQVFILAMPIKSLIAIFMLLFYGSIMIDHTNKLLLRATGAAPKLFDILRDGADIRERGAHPQEPAR